MTRSTYDLGSWCILRMNSGDTLRVVEALTERGLHVWAPVEWNVARIPGTRARYDKPSPILTGYAFGDCGHIDEFVRLAALRRKDFPRFRILESELTPGHAPLIRDSALDRLREHEADLREKFERAKRRDFKPDKPPLDDEVKMPDGPCAGLGGTVKRTKGRDVVVDIPGCPFTFKVSSLLALQSVAQAELPDNGEAAQAA